MNDLSENKPKSLWMHAIQTLLKDKMAVISFIIIMIYVIMAILSATGILAGDWSKEVGPLMGSLHQNIFLA
jgi:peptide/nickel transport system permease protein